MTHIVILFNRSQQEMSEDIANTKLKTWLNVASKETIESSNVWSKLDYLLDLPQKKDPQVLNVSPIKVEIGMRDSVCHALTEKNALISETQIEKFNDFFSGVFQLIKLPNGDHQIHFQQFLKFNLATKFLPPQLTDYRVQIDAAGASLKRHLTEMQSWCYQQNSMWNAFYLWSRPSDTALARINLDDRTQIKTLSKLNVFAESNAHADVKLVIVDELSTLSYDFMKIQQQFKESKLDKLSLSFTDNNFYHVQARDFYPWWKKLFLR